MLEYEFLGYLILVMNSSIYDSQEEGLGLTELISVVIAG